MIKLILKTLETDTALKSLLAATATDTRISAVEGDDFKTQIIYENNPLRSEDGIEYNRLSLKIFDEKDSIVEDIDKRIKELLLMYENVWLQDEEVCIYAIKYQDGNQTGWSTEGGPKLIKRDLNLEIVWRYK